MSGSFIKKSLYSLGSQILLIVLGMASGILVARVLGPELKGKAALITNAVQMLFMIGGLGLGSAFAYFIAKRKYDDSQVISFAIISSIFLGVVSVVLFYVTLPFHQIFWKGIDGNIISYAIILTVIYIFNSYTGRIALAYDMIFAANNIDIIKSVINILSIYYLIVIMKLGIIGFVHSLYVTAIIQAVFYIYLLRDRISKTMYFCSELFKESFSYGLKSYALTLINFLNYRIDMFVLKYFKGDIDVGYYSLAVGMAELLWLIPNATIAPLFNRIAGGIGDDKSLLTVRTCRWSIYILAFIGIISIVCGKFFIALLYGTDYLPSYTPFICLLPGICLFPIFKLLIVDLAARGMPEYGTITSVVALFTNFGMNVLLIPRYGAIGAAIASSISYSIMSLFSIVFFIKITNMKLSDILIPEKIEIEYILSKLFRKNI